ncbi:MAG: hypothetical protein WC809_07805 [Sinimarinibacterium sp.]|jgi:hypothetical protein
MAAHLTVQSVDLSPLIYLRARGLEADSFLQGQLSSDLRQLTGTRAQISSYNSPKGRMLAVAHLIRAGDSVLIELHRSVADSVLKRLRMFVLRSKLTLDDASAEISAVGLLGDDAAAVLAGAGLPVPLQALDCADDKQRALTVMRRFGEAPRYSIVGPATAVAKLATGLAPALPYTAWRRADIEAGVPVVYPETSDHFVPQMANLDRLGGISFDKGCYTGQEIVARLHYLGQLKRRLFVCRVDGAAPLSGSDIVAGEPPAPAGEVVDAVDAGDGSSRVSVVLQLAQAASADLRLVDGRSLHLRAPLPT